MNYLFVTDEFHPDFGANSLVVRAVCRQLASWGHRVYVLPSGYDPDMQRREAFEGITVVRELPADTKRTMLAAAKRLQFVKAGKILAMLLGSRILGSHSLWHKRKISARDYLEQFIRENDIHIAVSINCSVELSFPLLYLRQRGKLPCKWIFYMLDPFESHSYYRKHNSEKQLRKLQHRLMKQCDRILATELIYQDTVQWEHPEILRKIRITEFPKIEKPVYAPATDAVTLQGAGVHVVCTGTRNEQVRASAYTLALCKRIQNATFHFIGCGWAENVPVREDNLVFYPPHSFQAIRDMQLDADYLLNIGNAVSNQLPSKVLEYISTGKPVINIYKTDQCPAKALLEKWDALNICEGDDMEAQASVLTNFLQTEHAIPEFSKIEQVYRAYTPKAVAENFIA